MSVHRGSIGSEVSAMPGSHQQPGTRVNLAQLCCQLCNVALTHEPDLNHGCADKSEKIDCFDENRTKKRREVEKRKQRALR